MVIVTVDTTQLHILAVDLKDLANHLYLLHTQMIVKVLDDSALLILQLHTERIEIRLLCRPEMRLVNGIVQQYFHRIS